MSAEDMGLPALGYVVLYAALQAALAHRLEVCGMPTLWGARVTQVDGGTESARVRYERAGVAGARRLRQFLECGSPLPPSDRCEERWA